MFTQFYIGLSAILRFKMTHNARLDRNVFDFEDWRNSKYESFFAVLALFSAQLEIATQIPRCLLHIFSMLSNLDLDRESGFWFWKFHDKMMYISINSTYALVLILHMWWLNYQTSKFIERRMRPYRVIQRQILTISQDVRPFTIEISMLKKSGRVVGLGSLHWGESSPNCSERCL